MRLRLAVLVGGLMAVTAVTAIAQRGFGGFGRGSGAPIEPNAPYDGRFTFVRLRYGPPVTYQLQRIPWSHDYPEGERNMMKILNEISNLNPHIQETNVMALDDPELFKYPVVYLCEPGGWYVSEDEAAAFRAYPQKGGFVIVDDFRAYHWNNFETQIHRVLPDAKIVDLDVSHPIFHTFFEINDLEHFPQAYVNGDPVFKGIFEDNDRNKRLMAIINYNTDVSQFWEWSGRGLRPFDQTNEAYKLGVNYLIYGLTH